MQKGSIKASLGASSKTSGSAIRRVSGPVSKTEIAKSSEASGDLSKLNIRPGTLAEETKNSKAKNENTDDKGEVAKGDQNDARTFSNTREDGNKGIINRIWGKRGALTGIESNNINGSNSGSGISINPLAGIGSTASPSGFSGKAGTPSISGPSSSGSGINIKGGSSGSYTPPTARTSFQRQNLNSNFGGGNFNGGFGGTHGDSRGLGRGGNINFGSSRGVNKNGMSKTLSNGELGAIIHNKPSGLDLEELDWTKASMRGGRFYGSGEDLAEAIKPFIGNDKTLQDNAVFMATNKLSMEDYKSGKLDFLKDDQHFIENGKRLEYQQGAGQQYHDQVSEINKAEFTRLASKAGLNPSSLENTLQKYGIEDMANFSGRAFLNAAKDSQLLDSVDKTYDLVRSMYDANGTIPDVTVSADWFTSPRGDDTAFARSLRGMNLGQQSELKYQGLSAGDNNTIHMHLMAQGTEDNFMQFDSNGKLNGGLMGDFNKWKTGTFVDAVERLIKEEKEKGNDVSHLSADPAKVKGVFSRISGHGSPNEALAGVNADQVGTSMESGVIGEDKNQFAKDDANDIAEVFKQNFGEAELCLHEQSTCFGGSNALESTLDAIDKVTNGKVFGSGPRLEGLVTVDNMAKDGDNQYSTMLRLSDDTPLAVAIDRNGEDVNSQGQKNGDIDLVKGEDPDVDEAAIQERKNQIAEHKGESKNDSDSDTENKIADSSDSTKPEKPEEPKKKEDIA